MKRIEWLFSFWLMLLILFATSAYAESPREQLNQLVQLVQLVQQLQQNPSDNALREKIIKLAQGLSQKPMIPEEARRHFIEGTTIAKSATDASGQKLAVESYKEALKIAPWWSDAYYNVAVAQELAGWAKLAKLMRYFGAWRPRASCRRIAERSTQVAWPDPGQRKQAPRIATNSITFGLEG